MTYLGSGIWSYTCWEEDVLQSLLYNVWLRANLSSQLEQGFIPAYQSTNRLIIIQLEFKQLYCSLHSLSANREVWERENLQLTMSVSSAVFFPITVPPFHKLRVVWSIINWIKLTFRRAGAILLVSVPATIMTSACRGLALNTTPKRSMS